MPTSTRRDALLFTGISGKFGTAQGGRQSRRPLQKVFDRFPYPVGADDSVRPAECTVYLQKSSANSYAPRLPLGSRGAGQKGLRGFERCKYRKYSESCSVSHPSRLRRATSPYRAGRGKRRRWRTPANSYCPATLKCRAFFPQPFKCSCYRICCTVTGGAYHSAYKVTMCVRNSRKSGLA